MWKSSWLISNRFTRLKQNEKLYTWMYIISIATISLSVVALLSVTTITKSIHEIISTKMGGKYPYIEVHDAKELNSVKDSIGYNFIVKNTIILTKKGKDLAVNVFASKVKIENNIEIINKNLSKLNGDTIILSNELASKLDVKVGDKVLLSSSSINNLNNITQYLFTVIDLMNNNYQTQAIIPYNQVDATDLKNWKQMFVLEPKEILNIQPIIDDLEFQNIKRNKIVVWFDKIPSLYDAMKLEKIAIYTIFSILLLISSFTIFATISSLGIKRKRDVAILRMIGCRRKQIFIIFILQGIKIFIASSVIGVMISYLILDNINSIFSFVSAVSGLDIEDLLEVEKDNNLRLNMGLDLLLVIKILSINLIASIMAAIIPSYIIAKMETGDVVKYG